MKRKIELPDELKPTPKMYEMAKQIDKEFYKKMYKMLLDNEEHMTPKDAIDILVEMTALKIALQIGMGLTEYDVGILRGVIERHIASILYLE